MALNYLVCDPSGLTPLNNEPIQTAGDYLLHKKQLAVYRQTQAQKAQQTQAQKAPIILTCNKKIVKNSRSYETWTNYAKGQQMVCYKCPAVPPPPPPPPPPSQPLIIVGEISIAGQKDSTQTYLWDALTGALKGVFFTPTPNFPKGVSIGATFIVAYSNNEPTIFIGSTGLVSSVLPTTTNSSASAISSNAQYVVGSTNTQALFWSSFTAQPQVLPAPLGTVEYRATGVADTGMVVGNDIINLIPLAWNGLSGALLSLTFVLPALSTSGEVTCISADGKYVGGNIDILGSFYGYLWSGLDGSALPVQLQTPPNSSDGSFSVVGISDDGSIVVGNYINNVLGNVGVTWNRDTGAVRPTTYAPVPGFDTVTLVGIS